MESKEKEELVEKIDSLKNRYENLTKEREVIINELKFIFPIKEGDKIEIIHSETKEHIRFAFVNKIEINLRGKDRKAKIEFDLQKCRQDGTIGQHSDYLRINEKITKIK